MAIIDAPQTAHSFFSGTGANTVIFRRPINKLIITITGTVNMSLDNGTNFMPMTAGTYELSLYRAQIDFSGGGTYSGFGISL